MPEVDVVFEISFQTPASWSVTKRPVLFANSTMLNAIDALTPSTDCKFTVGGVTAVVLKSLIGLVLTLPSARVARALT